MSSRKVFKCDRCGRQSDGKGFSKLVLFRYDQKSCDDLCGGCRSQLAEWMGEPKLIAEMTATPKPEGREWNPDLDWGLE